MKTKKISYSFAIMVALVAVLFLSSCERKKCEKRYNALIVQEFGSLKEAVSETDAFLNDFQKHEKCSDLCDIVQGLNKELHDMDDLFDEVDQARPFDRYRLLKKMVKNNNNTFANSTNEQVRNLWQIEQDNRCDNYYMERVNLISEEEIREEMKKLATEIANRNFKGHPGFCTNYVKIKDLVIEDITTETVPLKQCVCKVHVEMEGCRNGMRKGTVDFEFEAVGGIRQSDGELIFEEGSETPIETTGWISIKDFVKKHVTFETVAPIVIRALLRK